MSGHIQKIFMASIVTIVGLVANAGVISVEPLQDGTLATTLSNLTILAEAEHPQSPAIHARVYRVIDHGECGGELLSCPMSTLYLAASEYGEYPEQRVFQLPKRHGWSFVAWRELPQSDGPQDFVVVELCFKTPSPTQNGHSWADNRVLVRFNYRQAVVSEP